MSGLLIVNADDWGGSESTTEAILRAFDAGCVTSMSGMIYMPDSERAAELARRKRLPVGLHLNLTEPFSAATVPRRVRDRQLRAIEHLSTPEADGRTATKKLRKWAYDPTIRIEVDAAISDQIARFEVLYGHPPTHLNGHNHVDLCPNVFLSRAIPRDIPMRSSLRCYPLQRSSIGVARAVRQRLRSRLRPSTSYLLHIAELEAHADSRIDPRLRLADQAPVEVMGHPDDPDEMTRLMSPEWEQAMGEYSLGSYLDLIGRPCKSGAAYAGG
jgi:chitin disaccharide deacetylase